MRPSLAVETSLKALGSNLKIARLRRRLPQSQVAERAGISLNTLAKVEAGDPGVAIGNVAAIMQAIGLGALWAISPPLRPIRPDYALNQNAFPNAPELLAV